MKTYDFIQMPESKWKPIRAGLLQYAVRIGHIEPARVAKSIEKERMKALKKI